MEDRDESGGDTRLKVSATGYFKLEKADRWWLVTPAGHAFLSFGLNHVGLDAPQRAEVFEHWQKEFGLPDKACIQAWVAPYLQRVQEDVKVFDFNTLGCHSPTDDFPHSFIPYVHSISFVDIAHWQHPRWGDFMDVFAPEFERHCDTRAKYATANRDNDPFLLGYSLTDCPIFTDLDAAERGVRIYGAPRPATGTWPHILRNLGGEAPGKQVYVSLMREVYADNVDDFNRTYATHFSSWNALAQAVMWRNQVDLTKPMEKRDNISFLEQIVDRYYATATAAIRHYDPNHLIFGDKLNGNTDTPDFIIKLAAKYMDLIFYQWYATYDEQVARLDHWSCIADKPLFNGDSSFSVPNPPHMPNPLGPQYSTQEERAAAFTDFAQRAFARPDFVGWSWCGWMDTWATVPNQISRQHSGLFDPYGNRYQPMVDAMSQFAMRMYDIAGI